MAQFQPKAGQKVHIFLSIAKFNEVDTGFFIRYFLENDIRIFLPKMIGDKIIAAEYTRDTKMEVNSWGIAEPASDEDSGITNYDFIITPLLYCDPNGNRVGYGKGYYDGFFASVNQECPKIGVGFFAPDVQIEDVSESDVALHYLVTPDEIVSFKGFS